MSNLSTQAIIEKYIRPEIQALSAYHVPDSSNMVKLDAMENPYPWPEEMKTAWLERLQSAAVNRYPDPAAKDLVAKIKTVMKVPEGNDVLLGNGSDELIQILAMTLAKPNAKLMAFDPGFVMYKMIAEFVGMEYLGVPLNEDFSLDMETTLLTIRQHQPALIFIAYPNNPTGNLFSAMDIEQILEEAEGLVVIDEAYQPFAEDTFMGQLGRHSNLMVMRTVSKLGLAGLRLGFLAGAPELIEEFDKIRLPYNINVLTQESALFALEHHDVFEQQAAMIRAERHKMLEALSQLEGIKVYPSRANFILFKCQDVQASQIFFSLKDNGILIKNLDPAGGPLAGCLRVTVGKAEENEQFLNVLTKLV